MITASSPLLLAQTQAQKQAQTQVQTHQAYTPVQTQVQAQLAFRMVVSLPTKGEFPAEAARKLAIDEGLATTDEAEAAALETQAQAL